MEMLKADFVTLYVPLLSAGDEPGSPGRGVVVVDVGLVVRQVARERGDNIREGVQKKSIFLGNSPKQRTPPTHRYGLGLT